MGSGQSLYCILARVKFSSIQVGLRKAGKRISSTILIMVKKRKITFFFMLPQNECKLELAGGLKKEPKKKVGSEGRGMRGTDGMWDS